MQYLGDLVIYTSRSFERFTTVATVTAAAKKAEFRP